ncbi:hypothetical protein AB205_0128080 [Aquarana catesbeiana]|uniref:Uncharacterized protein n=2 Tax=Aquarana catesbeiana TaxID=8400 RepID=A0A2G9PI76_AQUCT|nr:hypothetical protein AB205_0128080 [Aquarana catesbeiana]
MVQQVGKAEASSLTEIAKQVSLNRTQQANKKNISRDPSEPFIIFETAL